MEPTEIVSQWDKLIKGLKDWPWPYFLAIAIAGGTWGWLSYKDEVKDGKAATQKAIDATELTNQTLNKYIELQDKVLGQSYSKDTTKH